VPISLVWNLKMNPRTKLSVALILPSVQCKPSLSPAPLCEILLTQFQCFDWNYDSNFIRQRSLEPRGLPLCHYRRCNPVDQRNRNRHSSILNRYSPSSLPNFLLLKKVIRWKFLTRRFKHVAFIWQPGLHPQPKQRRSQGIRIEQRCREEQWFHDSRRSWYGLGEKRS
jgi:hypothetical protein